MNQNDDNTSASENDELDDILRALNDESVNAASNPVAQAAQPNTPSDADEDGIDRLRGLFADDEPVGKIQDDSQTEEQDVDALLSDLLVPSAAQRETGTLPGLPSASESHSQLDDDLDARLRDMISEAPKATTEPAQPLRSEPEIIEISSDEPVVEIKPKKPVAPPEPPAEVNTSPKTEPSPKTAKCEDGDLEELKQYIQFDENKAPVKDKSLMGRLNSDKAKKDPIVIVIFAFLIIILLALLGFIGVTVASSPAWHPTPVPSPTPLLDTTENYIFGLKVGQNDVKIKPVAGTFENWVPKQNEALVIEGSYFCRLVYLDVATNTFDGPEIKPGYLIYFNYSDSSKEPIPYSITSIEPLSFSNFGSYSSKQLNCVAIFAASSNRVILAEPVQNSK